MVTRVPQALEHSLNTSSQPEKIWRAFEDMTLASRHWDGSIIGSLLRETNANTLNNPFPLMASAMKTAKIRETFAMNDYLNFISAGKTTYLMKLSDDAGYREHLWEHIIQLATEPPFTLKSDKPPEFHCRNAVAVLKPLLTSSHSGLETHLKKYVTLRQEKKSSESKAEKEAIMRIIRREIPASLARLQAVSLIDSMTPENVDILIDGIKNARYVASPFEDRASGRG